MPSPAAAAAALGATLLHFTRRRTTALVLGAYALAVALPGPGLAADRVVLAGGGRQALGLPAALLAWTLVTAGAGVDPGKLKVLLRRPTTLVLGVAANLAAPLLVVLLFAAAAALLPASDEAQALVAGLAVVAAMPVGGTAAAWTTHHGGNTSLGVGALTASIAVSPLTIPLGLAVGSLTTIGDIADDLGKMTSPAGGAVGTAIVIAPCVLGMTARALWPTEMARALPYLRLATMWAVIALAYLNASSLPRALVRGGDVDFLLAVFAAAAVMCAGTFAAGWLLARAGRASARDAIALTYTTGMTNASLGAVVASSGLREHTLVLAPILAVSIMQTITAGWVGRLVLRGRWSC